MDNADREYPLPAPLFGGASWIGYIPRYTAELLISTSQQFGGGGMELQVETLTSRSRLVALGLSRAFRKTLTSIGERLWGDHDLARDQLQVALGTTNLRKYHDWRLQSSRALDLAGLEAPRAEWLTGPHFVVLIDATGDPRATSTESTVQSLVRQSYPHWSAVVIASRDQSVEDCNGEGMDPRIVVVEAGRRASNLWSQIERRAFIAPIGNGDVLPPYAFGALAAFVAAHPAVSLIYADEDRVDVSGKYHCPQLKPDWSPVFFESMGYVGRARIFCSSLLSRLGELSVEALANADPLWGDLAGSPSAPVGHVRRVLLSRYDKSSRPQAHLKERSSAGEAPPPEIGSSPCATIIIPTRDRADLLGPCLRSLAATVPTDFEVLIVDNGSVEQATHDLYQTLKADRRFRVLNAPGKFNFSRLCNRAAAEATAGVMVFLNNDTEVTHPEWLSSLVHWAGRAGIGAVGAKLIYPSGRLQHGGLVLGLGSGLAAHIDSGEPGDQPGYLGRRNAAHEVSAVTGACLAVSKAHFDSVGGFDVEAFPVELGDVDLCLRLAERGLRTVVATDVVLVHHESATRGRAGWGQKAYADEQEKFLRRWANRLPDDPYFHPALSLKSVTTMLE